MSAQANNPVTTNQRQFPRQEIQIEIELSFLDDITRKVTTRNISQGGMFLQLDDIENYPMGEMVHVHYRDPLMDDRETEKDAVIVRHAEDGIAIAFVEIDSF